MGGQGSLHNIKVGIKMISKYAKGNFYDTIEGRTAEERLEK